MFGIDSDIIKIREKCGIKIFLDTAHLAKDQFAIASKASAVDILPSGSIVLYQEEARRYDVLPAGSIYQITLLTGVDDDLEDNG